MNDSDDKTYEVGYGRPPKATRFAKGRSGNPGGRPRKRTGPVKLDLAAILDKPIMATTNGVRKAMHPHEVRLLQALKKGLEGDVGELIYVYDQLLKSDAFDLADAVLGGVVTLPSKDMPWTMAKIMAERFGAGPWNRRQIKAGRKAYLASRSPAQARIDDAIEYKDLQP